jgi:Retrotransposon gag protein/Zinc knuckle
MMALIAELHAELTAQRTIITQLTTGHESHEQMPVPSRADAGAPSFTPKKNRPPTFDGKSPPDSWIAHMDSYVNGISDEQAFSIAITYLVSDAHDWFIANQVSATAAGHPMVSWVALTDAIKKRFSPLNKVKIARDKLSRWRQLRDVPSYNTDFLKIILDIPRIGLDEQIDRYARGLKPYIWSELCTTDYESLEDLMRDAERIESAKGNRFKTNPQGTQPFRSGPVPMELNNTKVIQKLSPEEREKCMREGLCLRCREKGHLARDCPKNVQRN